MRRLHLPPLLSRQIEWIRWLVPLLAMFMVLAHQIIEQMWFPDESEFHFMIDMFAYGFAGPFIIWTALDWIKQRVEVKEKAEVELVQAHTDLTSLNQRISFLLNVNQRLAQVTDEDALADLTLQLPGEATPAVVSSAMIRFDDHHQPMPIEYQGTLDETVLARWHQHLSAQSVRVRCQACRLHAAKKGDACPMLQELPVDNVGSIFCQPLKRNNREFGILGLFLASGSTLSQAERQLLETITEEIATAFENVRLRTRELTTFYDINETLQLRLDLQGLMGRLLELTVEASNADAGLLLLREAENKLTPYGSMGDWGDVGWLPLVESLAEGALRESAQRHEPVVVTLRGQTSNPVSVLCAPMLSDDGPLGVIVLGSRQPEAVFSRQTRLVAAIAGQAALLAQNARLYAQLENQAILTERGRLAREMHDGLAQTLGYLKMRSRQIARWVDSGQTEKASSALQELAKITDDAYLDLRAALDGLRTSAGEDQNIDFCTRLTRCVTDFERQTGLGVSCALDPNAASSLSMPAQAHLVRIAQESLANIRKHAYATQVSLSLCKNNDVVQLVVQDNGQGFDAMHDQPNDHHGLRLMRERADLLGAELQITSAPGRGTRVCAEWHIKSVVTNG
ncbi:MAG: GAF domain-containing sensor histidine kinase [Chloroflexi bacterium]|nr:GAF domain-containing sensor histidine kinase [Chloroflexota bacterium]